MRTTVLLASLAVTLSACGNGDRDAASERISRADPIDIVRPPAGQKWTEVVSQTLEGGYVMGNPNAPLKLVEYGSRLCPTCGAFANTGMKPLIDNYVASGKLSYEFREYLVHGAPDFAPALLGRCAGTAPFFPLLEAMFAAQPTILPKMGEDMNAFQASLQGKSPPQVFTAWAERLGYIDFVKQRGIPEAQARACINNQKSIDELVNYMDAGSQKGVNSTPTFFLNGDQLQGVASWPAVETALKNAGA